MKKLLLATIISCLCLSLQAQVFTGFIKDIQTHIAINNAAVVAMDSLDNPIAFCNTDKAGRFSLTVKPDGKMAYLMISSLGYAMKRLPVNGYEEGMTVNLHQTAVVLKDVEVKSNRLRQKSDTLVYSVAGFKQKQDRSIADVISKMPGLDVKESGMITYQGTPINKFYIEGMDLMGKKYAMASENLQAKKVKNVEVLRHHQPIKALSGVIFSDQAALNLVLEDDAKLVLNSSLESGLGTQLQRSPSEDLLRDSRAVAMLFGPKRQNLTMYKCNNTGRDIQHEVRDLTSSNDLEEDDNNWTEDIALSTPSLKLERYNCNDTHVAATNWLFKTDADTELRFQGVYLFDNTTGYKKDITTFTNILNRPVMEEETEANKYRRELNAELQYKKNRSDLYVDNVLRTSLNWNESSATTMLNGASTRQYVRPRKSDVSDKFSLIKNLKNDKSLDLNAMFNYRFLPGTLLTIDSQTPQRLNVNTVSSQISTSFRHRLFGMYISYNAQAKYHHDQIRLNENEDVSYQEVELKITPRINFERYGLRSSFSLPVFAAAYSLAGLRKNKIYANPYLSLSYSLGGTMDFTFNYNHQTNLLETSKNVPITYFTDYTTRMEGNGKLNFIYHDSFDGKFEYSNPNIGLFFYVSGNYVKLHNVPMYGYNYSDNIYTIKSTDRKSDNEQIVASAEVSKAFGYGKFTITIGGDLSRNNYATLVSDQVARCHFTDYSAHLQFAFMPTALFSMEEKSTFNCLRTVNNTYPELTSNAVNSFKHELTVFFMPGNWKFSLTNDLYHSNEKDISTAYFADFKCVYSRKRYELSLVVNNLFGSKSYERHTVTNTTTLFTLNTLRPREFVAKVAFSF